MQRSLRAHDTPRLHARSAGCCLSRELGAATTLTSWFWVQEKTLLCQLSKCYHDFEKCGIDTLLNSEGVLYHSTCFTHMCR